MSTYQYYEFLAVDRPLDARQQDEVRALSTRARITATSFTNEYHWGDFRGDPRKMVERLYDAHLYLANWGTRRVMLRLPRALLALKVAEQYCVDPQVTAWTTGEHLVLDLSSEDEGGDWVEGAEDSLSAIVGVRAELAAGDLRPLYLAWLAAYGVWERDEEAFDDEEEDDLEPPVPAGLGSLTAPQRALVDFLRLDADLLAAAAQASPPAAQAREDPHALAGWIKDLPSGDKEKLLLQVTQGHGARVQMEVLRRFRGEPDPLRDGRPRRTVAQLLDAAADIRQERRRHAEAARAEQDARDAQARALAREKRLDTLARDGDTAWGRVDALIDTRRQSDYDAAVDLLGDLQALASRSGTTVEFARRFTLLRQVHLRKPSLIARFDRAGLGAVTTGQ
ncbi:hypothetical protein E0F15_12910 [Frankia sp. B2]|uniref:hypothetical protein n=1 Tax=unclassified Frankia TaxID=2632575 RepID=UPI00046124DE|nr:MULTISPECIES: hypothetical protein [unclassified Frankia]KDA43023.1 hypothetical protein BMG523Draft_02078 [Frankia sp. BMG5.23]TFE29769.1 hypothetical protein E0F15_12910 [Frankia sp. B2]